MTIESSTVIVDRPLKGLTRRIKTKHIDHLGNYTNYSRDVMFNVSDNVVDSAGNVLFADLDAYVANNAVKAQDMLADREAEEASETNDDIIVGEFATRELKALKYLRKAYALEDPYQAYLKFTKFNEYRLDKGWILNQVVAGLSTVGLTQDEWDLMSARYTYLSNAQRVTAMENYQLVLAGDIRG